MRRAASITLVLKVLLYRSLEMKIRQAYNTVTVVCELFFVVVCLFVCLVLEKQFFVVVCLLFSNDTFMC